MPHPRPSDGGEVIEDVGTSIIRAGNGLKGYDQGRGKTKDNQRGWTELVMNEVDNFIGWIRTENVRLYAEKVKDYCETHSNCGDCGFFNGTCRFNNIPANWSLSPERDSLYHK